MKAESQSKVPIPPIEKKCRVCKERKLLLDFEIDQKNKDKHENICKSCVTKVEEDDHHSPDCITNKFLIGVYTQLECLLALVEDGVELPDEILEILGEIVTQDIKNKDVSDG